MQLLQGDSYGRHVPPTSIFPSVLYGGMLDAGWEVDGRTSVTNKGHEKPVCYSLPTFITQL